MRVYVRENERFAPNKQNGSMAIRQTRNHVEIKADTDKIPWNDREKRRKHNTVAYSSAKAALQNTKTVYKRTKTQILFPNQRQHAFSTSLFHSAFSW